MCEVDGLFVIWMIFGMLFLFLSGVHLKLSWKKMKLVPDMTVTDANGIEVSIFKKVTTMINTHVEDLNESGKKQNIVSSIGYLAAAFTAFVSAYLTMRP